MRVHRTRLAVMMILMLVVTVACKDKTLSDVSHYLNVETKAMNDIQHIIFKANKTTPPLIDKATADKIIALCLHIDKATHQGITLTRNLNALGATDKASLLGILNPILDEVNKAVADPAVSGIKDDNTRIAVQRGLAAIQTAMNSTKLLIAAGGK